MTNNPAWDQPAGRQYARNYKASIVLANRKSDGANYFALKTRAASNMTPKARRVQALMAAVSIIRSYLLGTGDLEKLQTDFAILKADGRLSADQNTFNRWFYNRISSMLTNKMNSMTFAYGGEGFIVVTVQNPWAMLNTSAPVIAFESFIKFAPYFAYSRIGSDVVAGAAFFKVDGVTYLAPYKDALSTAEQFEDLLSSSQVGNPNTHYAGWTTTQEATHLYIGGMPVYDQEGLRVALDENIAAYTQPLTTIPPQS